MTECSRCGDCCDPVHMRPDRWENITATAGYVSPEEDPQAWRDLGFTDDNMITKRRHAEWLVAHWTEIPDQDSESVLLACDQFDPQARLCTAHDARPDICRGYPWYGDTPDAKHGTAGQELSANCSFWADVPAEDRPPEWVPVAFTGARVA